MLCHNDIPRRRFPGSSDFHMGQDERRGQAAAVPSRADDSLWSAVPDAIRGSHEDYTKVPLRRAIVLLAIPMMLELVMESTFGLVDIYFVGKLGSAAVATVGLTGSLIILVFAIVMGLSMGATAMVARRIGEGDPEAAALAAWQAILAGVLGAAPVSLCGMLLAPKLLGWMGGSEDIVAGYRYTAVLFAGSVTIFLLFLNNAIFRGAGDAAVAMRALWLANLINIVLDPLLIFGIGPFPALGLFGAALATTIGRGLGVVYQMAMLCRSGGRVTLTRKIMHLDRAVFRHLLSVSTTGMVQFFVATAAWLGVTRIIAVFGETVLAGYTITLRLIHFAILPSWGVSNAAATLVGQNLGASKPDRAERAVWLTGLVNFAMLSVIAVVFWSFARPLITIFTAAPGVIARGVESLKILSTGYIFGGFSMVFGQAFNGAGDTATPAWINFLCYWCWQLPLAYVLAKPMGVGVLGVYGSVVISGLTWALVGYILFRRGSWKEYKI